MMSDQPSQETETHSIRQPVPKPPTARQAEAEARLHEARTALIKAQGAVRISILRLWLTAALAGAAIAIYAMAVYCNYQKAESILNLAFALGGYLAGRNFQKESSGE